MASILKFLRSACARSAQQPNADINRGERRDPPPAEQEAERAAAGAVALVKLEEEQRWLDTMHPPRPPGAVDPRGGRGSEVAMSRALAAAGRNEEENTGNWRARSWASLKIHNSIVGEPGEMIVGEPGEMGYRDTDDMYVVEDQEGKLKVMFTESGQTKYDVFKTYLSRQVPAGAEAAQQTAETYSTYAGRIDSNKTLELEGIIF